MAIDNRRHDTVTHQSKAISVHNLRDQVRARYPEGTIFCQNCGCDGSSGLKLPIHVVKCRYTGKTEVEVMFVV